MSESEIVTTESSRVNCEVSREDVELLKRMAESVAGRVIEIGRITYDEDSFIAYIVIGKTRKPHLVYVRVFCA